MEIFFIILFAVVIYTAFAGVLAIPETRRLMKVGEARELENHGKCSRTKTNSYSSGNKQDSLGDCVYYHGRGCWVTPTDLSENFVYVAEMGDVVKGFYYGMGWPARLPGLLIQHITNTHANVKAAEIKAKNAAAVAAARAEEIDQERAAQVDDGWGWQFAHNNELINTIDRLADLTASRVEEGVELEIASEEIKQLAATRPEILTAKAVEVPKGPGAVSGREVASTASPTKRSHTALDSSRTSAELWRAWLSSQGYATQPVRDNQKRRYNDRWKY